jgi:hypothetical protein
MTATPDAATTVRLLLEAFLAGDMETFMSYVDDDLEWNPALHHPFLTHQYRGREQFLNGAVATVAAELDGLRFDIEQYIVRAAVTELTTTHGQEQRTSFGVHTATAGVRDGRWYSQYMMPERPRALT